MDVELISGNKAANIWTSIKISDAPNEHNENFPFNTDTEINEVAVRYTENSEHSLSHLYGRAKDSER